MAYASSSLPSSGTESGTRSSGESTYSSARPTEVELAARRHVGVEHELADEVGKVRHRREQIGGFAAELCGHEAVGLIAGALIETVKRVVIRVVDVFFGHDPAS